MSGLFSKLSKFTKQYPVARGMIIYSLIYPTSCLIQQTIEGKRYDTYDWLRCLRFCLYGSLFVAPFLYGWVRTSSMMWPRPGLKTSLIKAGVEQISYTPFQMICFYFGMSILELRPLHEGVQEVLAKFPPTYKVGLCVWPAVAIINFTLIRERNRVPFISLCSLVWTSYLACMIHNNSEQTSQGESPTKFIPMNINKA